MSARKLVAARPDGNHLERRFEEIRTSLASEDPYVLAFRTGSKFKPINEEDNAGVFRLAYWGKEIEVQFPAFDVLDVADGKLLNAFEQTLIAYYFQDSDGMALTGKWIAFSELPDGMFYKTAFQGYTGKEILKTFGEDAEAFERAALALNGKPVDIGDKAFSYQMLPMFRLAVVCWFGDDEFPPSYRVLFDESAGHHLSADGCAIVGSMLAKRLIKVKG
ncbi:MAG: DUF3786 domain-containing protein [Anaerolineales bacterium]|nr:DUF3786 domain-containing protein [Anaerolineales bacterium]